MKKNLIILLLFAFAIPNKTFSQDTIIKSGDLWSYYDKGYLNPTWFTEKNINKWQKGVTPIGYGDRQVITNINYGGDKENKHYVKYFSKTITLNNPRQYLAYCLQFIRDDGIVVYLNGKEVFRDNLPKTPLKNNTRAINVIQREKEEEVVKKMIDSKEFLKGKNTINVAIHQVSSGSSDCIFDMRMLGYNDPRALAVLLEDKKEANNELEKEVNKLNTDIVIERISLKLLMEENRNENLLFTIYTIFFLFIAVLAFFVFTIIDSRKKRKENKVLLDKKEDIILKKDQDLLTMSTKLLHNRQYFKEIKSDLKSIKGVNENALKEITYNINLALEAEDEWINLSKHFNAVFDGFYDRLIDRHPDLTEVEIRHCMFIKLHLSTKEIANILLIDPRSVQTSRYRIKKKMELAEDVDLRSYLLEL